MTWLPPIFMIYNEMIAILLAFVIAFLFSFVGTIPPGTLSLTIMQLGLQGKIDVAWRMAFAAAVIEYPYAWIAVEFQDFLAESLELTHNFHLISALVMMTLGAFSLWSAARPSTFSRRFEASGFRKGIVLALLNPLAVPFWMAVTAYLESYGWVDLSHHAALHAYLLGVSLGSLVLFMLLAYLAKKVVTHLQPSAYLQKLPGTLLILLGVYSLSEYIFG